MSAITNSESLFINVAKETGIDIIDYDGAIIWTGPKGGILNRLVRFLIKQWHALSPVSSVTSRRII